LVPGGKQSTVIVVVVRLEKPAVLVQAEVTVCGSPLHGAGGYTSVNHNAEAKGFSENQALSLQVELGLDCVLNWTSKYWRPITGEGDLRRTRAGSFGLSHSGGPTGEPLR
jgi:hypothetical protein